MRKDTGQDWKEYLRTLAQAEGIENPTDEDLRRLDQGRKDKKVSNQQWVGRTAVKYIPINETVELELGNDREVLVRPTLMNWEKTNLRFDNDGNVKGWTIKETWQIEAQNSKDIDIILDIRRNFSGDWTIKSDAKYEAVDATKAKFLVPLKPREKQQFTYELTTNFGSTVTR